LDFNIPLGNYSSGEFGPFDVSDNATEALVEWRRCTTADSTIWPRTTTGVTMEIFQFHNGEWRTVAKFSNVGGIQMDKTGAAEQTKATCAGPLFPGSNRQIKVTVDVEDPPVRTFGVARVT
jgi:hypothetical protein